MLSKPLRTFGLVVCVGTIGVLGACSPEESEKVGDDSQPILESGYTRDYDLATSSSSGSTSLATKPSGTPRTYSACQPLGSLYEWSVDPKTVAGNTRVSIVDQEGTVACVWTHDNEYPVGRCKVDLEKYPHARSKELDGRFVVWGIGFLGENNEYAVAREILGTSKVFNKTTGVYDTYRKVACTPPQSYDAAGTAAGTELAGVCIYETFNVPSNAAGTTMDNYATRKVCSKVPATTDTAGSATYVGTDAYGNQCYTGDGAALNDVNGTERNSSNVYLSGSSRCHVALSGGYEVFAAKRPSTKSWPAPGVVDPSSSTWWRTVSSVPVAN